MAGGGLLLTGIRWVVACGNWLVVVCWCLLACDWWQLGAGSGGWQMVVDLLLLAGGWWQLASVTLQLEGGWWH
jgi:hypothetical protein